LLIADLRLPTTEDELVWHDTNATLVGASVNETRQIHEYLLFLYFRYKRSQLGRA
jgi:hypothetical protein